ncbi:MAG TPA: universal stress protein [Gaiellaceae bacterium]|nr:universal stress protein [Gaiellaceae bacterium]
MKNRFLGEADAYLFLIVAVIVHCGIVVGAHFGGPRLALGAIVFLTPLALGLVLRKPAPELEPLTELPRSTNPRRILVVANETVAGEALADEVRARVRDETEVMVVCPALNSRLRHWTSDEDPARTAAQDRLQASLERLAETGVDARGLVGDADPLQAIADALRDFGADEIVISTHPPERSHWLARNITERAQRLFGLPVTHVVVDLEVDAAAQEPAVA